MASDESHGGSVKLYWVFCAVLCLITFLEWLIFKYRVEWQVATWFLVVALTAMSLVKFTMVVGWYMHLRYDPKLLKQIFIFSVLLIFGVAAGLIVLML